MSALHHELHGYGAYISLELSLTVVPASSMVMYGAILCQAIACQYPIYHLVMAAIPPSQGL